VKAMSVENISEGLGSHQIQKGLLNSKQKTRSKDKEETSSPSPVDRVEISEDAKKLAKEGPFVRQLGQTDKDIQYSKLYGQGDNPLTKITWDSSEQKETIKKIIETFMKENGGLSSLESGDVDSEVRWTKIQEVGRRIEAQYYKSRDVVSAIVDKLMGF